MSEQKVKRLRRPACGSVYAGATVAERLDELRHVTRGDEGKPVRCRKSAGHLGGHEWWSATRRVRWE